MSSLVLLSFLLTSVIASPLFQNQPRTLFVGSGKKSDRPSTFTSAFHARATNTTIINSAGASVAGQAGALGQFAFYLNSKEETICWEISLTGVTGEYSSPARTATHIHQAAAGAAGPPRIAFPNPTNVGTNYLGQELRRSSGCMKGPFVTGINATGTTTDTGSASGFKLSAIEANPSGFFADTHTATFTAGAVRGQLLSSEIPISRPPKKFTSIIKARADGNQVVNTLNQTNAGQPGASGKFTLKLNTHENVLCYEIEVNGVSGEPFSPAKTATHTHQASKGANGPPRLAFANPKKSWWWSKTRKSSGCFRGPHFTTGLTNAATGLDTGSASGFTLKQLEDNPSAFFSDTHTDKYVPGAVRGQNYKS